MAANILDNLANWSTTDASNQPDGSDTADLDAEFRRLQAVIRKYTRTKGADIASAATCDLATATGDYVDITGTTGITAFGTVSAGMRFLLQFDDAVTITHAASLLLPGGADITTAAGDVLMMESLGSGNWKCLVYQPVAGNAKVGANSDITSLSGLTTPLSVAQGGIGVATLTDKDVLIGNGTGAVQGVSPGASGNVLTSNGTAWESATPIQHIGTGQTWQDVSGSRSKNVEYTNSTGRAIMVAICSYAASNIDILCDGVVIGTTSAASERETTSFIVPPGSTYKWDSASGTISSWAELR